SSIAKRKYSRTVKYKRGCANVLTQPPQHKHKIKHDKTTMQSFLSMPGRHKYYLRIFAYS
ncbi:hypothetical protein GA413_21405, partial [Bacteroides xylanisolvens]